MWVIGRILIIYIANTEAVQQLLSVTNILLIFRFKAPIHLYFLRILNYWTACTRCIFKKSLSLTLNNEKTTVILKVNKITDEFYIKDEEKLKVFEPELKYRFRKIYPHLNVYNKSDRLNKIIGLVIFAIILITIILIIFKSKLNYIWKVSLDYMLKIITNYFREEKQNIKK